MKKVPLNSRYASTVRMGLLVAAFDVLQWLVAGPVWHLCVLLLAVGITARPTLGQWEPDHWPSSGPPGVVTSPWRPTNADSTHPLKLGIADAPVNAFTATTLPDGRVAAAFESIRVKDGKPRIFLHVRALGDKGWVDAMPPLKLRDSQAIERRWKDVKFLMGKVLLSRLEARALPDGRLRIVGVELWGERKGNDRVMRIWDIRDDKWTRDATWRLAVPGDSPNNISEELQIGPSGEVYWSGLRTCWRKPDADTPKDHAALMSSPRHPHSGELRCETLVVRRYDPETGEVLVMDYEASPSAVHGVPALSSGTFLHEEGLPLIGIVGLPVGEKATGKSVTSAFQWRAGQWQSLPVPEDLGLPAGQRPDGMPVWVIKPETRSTDGSYRPATMKFTPAQFVELDAAGEVRRETLPADYTRAFFEAPWVRYVDGRPLVSMLGHYRAGKGAAFLVGLATRGNDGKWTWLGSRTTPPYWRPAHGGHDGITKQRWAVGKDQVLLLWQGAMPIHGPLTVSGAWAPRSVLPAVRPGTRPGTPVPAPASMPQEP